MSCCQNPVNLGCYDSCSKVTIDTIEDYDVNELYLTYNFNGAVRKTLITEVTADGNPIIDLSTFNEDYFYTFEIIDRATGESLGCFKIKVEPCAGEIFDIPAADPITDFLNSTMIFGEPVCNGDTLMPFVIDISDLQIAALQDGSIINISFSALNPVAGMEVFSDDPNLVVLSVTQVLIVSIALFTTFDLILKISGCDANTITGVVTSFSNLSPTWGNGTHTPETKVIY